MRTYQTVTKRQNILQSIVCDRCKEEYLVDVDYTEVGEFLYIDFTGGYGSVFGDMNSVQADICQHCLKELINDFVRIGEIGDNGEIYQNI